MTITREQNDMRELVRQLELGIMEAKLREALAENKRILDLHKGLMAAADSRLEAAERGREGAQGGC